MAQQAGWTELYDCLDSGRQPDPKLVELCKGSRTGIGETMLHWYAVEGESTVLEKLVGLGFPVNTQNKFGKTPIMEAALIGRWDNVRVLLDRGADLSMRNKDGCDFFEFMERYRKEIPEWISR